MVLVHMLQSEKDNFNAVLARHGCTRSAANENLIRMATNEFNGFSDQRSSPLPPFSGLLSPHRNIVWCDAHLCLCDAQEVINIGWLFVDCGGFISSVYNTRVLFDF